MKHEPITITFTERRWISWRATAELAFWVILFGVAIWI
jgi:hypothetical protein